MLTGNRLIAALASLPTLSTQGQVSRVIHIRYVNTALSSIGSLQKGGRYNLPQAFEALYLAEDPVTALLEVEAIAKIGTQLRFFVKPPLVVLSLYYQINAILDLTNPDNQRVLGTNLQELTGNWLLMSMRGQAAPTQILGEAAYNLQSIEALKVPSARDPNTYKLGSSGQFMRLSITKMPVEQTTQFKVFKISKPISRSFYYTNAYCLFLQLRR